MIIKVRHSWETNSSSSHSLVLIAGGRTVNATDFGKVVDNILTIIPTTIDFGWQWEIWDSPIEKLCYLLLDGLNEERAKKLLKEKLNVDEVCLPDWEKYKYSAYIDHDSIGTTREIINSTDEELWNFITGDSQIRGGNDNEEGPW